MKKLELIIGGVDTIQVIGKVDFVIKDISKNSNDVDTNYLFVLQLKAMSMMDTVIFKMLLTKVLLQFFVKNYQKVWLKILPT